MISTGLLNTADSFVIPPKQEKWFINGYCSKACSLVSCLSFNIYHLNLLYSKSLRIRTYFLRARMKLVLNLKVLRLISRYRGSYLKGASCSPLESIKKMSSPVICFGSVLLALISNWGAELSFQSQLGPQ